ncbi:MAG: hypothetical protein HQL40_07010 [Alphaproteobacteria bacterium]|nr:hypothetical protein [Alphaproteobacteria bacterium]
MKNISLADQAMKIEMRKAQLGLVGDAYVPLNSGTLRTDSKRALLREIEAVSAAKGRPPRFAAKY